jgi:hypothetical protein
LADRTLAEEITQKNKQLSDSSILHHSPQASPRFRPGNSMPTNEMEMENASKWRWKMYRNDNEECIEMEMKSASK